MKSDNNPALGIATGDPLPYLADSRPEVRRLAASACAARLGQPGVVAELAGLAQADPDERVRAEAVEVLACAGRSAYGAVWAARLDSSSVVVEAAATALGELEDPAAVEWLLEAATGHSDEAVREAAVAALGAIGDRRALPLLVELAGTGSPKVRRRAVVALTAFDDGEAGRAISTAALDRNPMVREVAEQVLGRRARPSGNEP